VTAWLDGILKLVTYSADSLPGRFGRRIRRLRMDLRRVTPSAAQITLL
jgi:hypothetical protein